MPRQIPDSQEAGADNLDRILKSQPEADEKEHEQYLRSQILDQTGVSSDDLDETDDYPRIKSAPADEEETSSSSGDELQQENGDASDDSASLGDDSRVSSAPKDERDSTGNGNSPGAPHALTHRPRLETSTGPSLPSDAVSRKRRRASNTTDDEKPSKRSKSDLRRDYITILNADIADAAAGHFLGDNGDLGDSQIGLTLWTSAEKELLFASLARLGPDNVRGIANRLGTKDELEVMQYLQLLRDGAKNLRLDNQLEPLDIADHPAALEVSQSCCQALEATADDISKMEEQRELAREKKQWGDHAILTKSNLKRLANEAPEDMQALDFFQVHRWLGLSSRLFMNSPTPECNWQDVSTQEPSIRATALEDFRSLAVFMTRRLVMTTIAMAEARVRTKSQDHTSIQKKVGWRDVHTAATSLGLAPTNIAFWARCARRLSLNVVDDRDENETPRDGGAEFMSFDEVEAALGIERDGPAVWESHLSEVESLASMASEEDIRCESGASDDDGDGANADHNSALPPGVSEEGIQRELKELFLHTTLTQPPAHRPRRAAKAAIAAELGREVYADRLDEHAGYEDHVRLWAVLGREVPEDVPRVAKPEDSVARGAHRVGEFYASGEDWRDGLDDGRSQWEFVYQAGEDSTGA